MTNGEIAAIFREIADLLVKKKENWFKVRAYRKVADEIDKLHVDVTVLAGENRLKEIPGAGEAITKKITEMITTGKLQLLERLRTEIRENTGDRPAK